jgi:hypothetical protein
MFERELSLMKPQMDRAEKALDLQLRQQGLMPGTEGYDNAMGDLRQTQTQQLADLTQRSILAGGAEQSRLAGLDLAKTQYNAGQDESAYDRALRGQLQGYNLAFGLGGDQRATVATNNLARGEQVADLYGVRNQALKDAAGLYSLTAPPGQIATGMAGQATSYAPDYIGANTQQYNAATDRYNAYIGALSGALRTGLEWWKP